ncbi:hypothetical protein MAR_014026 [Mya arenaria]|uniref:Uncharacterized protein n=1 Tax=Mya arenaria TaxID=6604 RepID=A0ABY7G333_MYAAR|nr:hypothetical protein MAR_014026 [Mya arenaria]
MTRKGTYFTTQIFVVFTVKHENSFMFTTLIQSLHIDIWLDTGFMGCNDVMFIHNNEATSDLARRRQGSHLLPILPPTASLPHSRKGVTAGSESRTPAIPEPNPGPTVVSPTTNPAPFSPTVTSDTTLPAPSLREIKFV